MSVIKAVGAALFGMFLGDGRLTIGIVLLVACAGALIYLAGIDPLFAGTLLALGCPLLLIQNVALNRR